MSLEVLDISGGDLIFGGTSHQFTGGIPSEWGALTNLKELKMVACGLDGERCKHTCVCMFDNIFTFLQENCPRSSANSST